MLTIAVAAGAAVLFGAVVKAERAGNYDEAMQIFIAAVLLGGVLASFTLHNGL